MSWSVTGKQRVHLLQFHKLLHQLPVGRISGKLLLHLYQYAVRYNVCGSSADVLEDKLAELLGIHLHLQTRRRYLLFTRRQTWQSC